MSSSDDDSADTRTEIPADPLNFVSLEAGFLPSMGVHRNGTSFVISPSRSRWVWAVASWVIAGILVVVEVPFLPFLWVLAPPLLIGSIIGIFVMPSVAREFSRQAEMVADPDSEVVTVTRGDSGKKIPFNRMVGFQLLPRSGRRQAGQLNLVFRDEDGKIDRTCLMSHAIHFYLVRAARKLATLSNWPVFDHTGETIDPVA
jgi:energy-coupling factor transporter transmembrane protein EcfT